MRRTVPVSVPHECVGPCQYCTARMRRSAPLSVEYEYIYFYCVKSRGYGTQLPSYVCPFHIPSPHLNFPCCAWSGSSNVREGKPEKNKEQRTRMRKKHWRSDVRSMVSGSGPGRAGVLPAFQSRQHVLLSRASTFEGENETYAVFFVLMKVSFVPIPLRCHQDPLS